MAGSNDDFDASAFREAIQFAMNMGLPSDTSERATFRWRTERSFDKADSGGDPFSWDSSPTSETSRSDVQLACAVEYVSRISASEDTNIGPFDPSRVVITLLDEQYDTLTQYGDFPDVVLLGGNEYEIKFVGPPVGLFEVTVYQVHAQARDES